ncbi:MAG: TolC family protein [Deltaproteobacteria bacterium]|nr:TolC family protein [Deltaproteobacteria bacterium]
MVAKLACAAGATFEMDATTIRFATRLGLAALVYSVQARAQTVSLDECIRRSLERAPAIQAAEADVRMAGAEVRSATAAYSPRLLAHSEYGYARGFDEAVTNGGSTAAVVAADATLFDGGRRDAQLKAARDRLSSASARRRQQRADTVQAVRSWYFQALAAAAEGSAQAEGIDVLRDAVALLERQKTLGFVPPNDVLRAQLAMSAADTERRSALATQTTALGQLEVLSGLSLPPHALNEAAAIAAPQMDERRLNESPVVADAQAALAAAQHDADAVRSERRPQVTLEMAGGALGVRPGRTFRDDAGGQFLVGMSLPLFDGGANAAHVAAAVAAANHAEAALAQARQTVTLVFGSLRVEAERADAEASIWRQSIPLAEDNLTLMRARYFGGGNVRLLEVLDALSQVVSAKVGLARSRLSFAQAIAAQQQLLGEDSP